MIQRMRNTIPIDVSGFDLAGATNIEVYLEQKSTGLRLKFSGDEIFIVDDDTLEVNMSKDAAMRFSTATVRAQIAYTDSTGTPGATKPFYIPVYELLWREGYGD